LDAARLDSGKDRMDLQARFIRHVLAPAWAWWEWSDYLTRQPELQRSQYDPPEVVEAKQWNRLRQLLQHAYDTVPFYRRRLDAIGLHPRAVQSIEDYRQLPVLTKQDIRDNADALLSANYAKSRFLHRKKTSGSTGTSLEVFVDEAAQQFKRACVLRADQWSGWRLGERVAMVWGNPDYLQRGWRGRLRNALLERRTYLDTLDISDETLSRFARELVRRPPSLIFGHAHSVYLLAAYLRQAGLPPIRPRGIITSAMVLHGWQRRVIEEVFDRPVTNRYGCEEVSLIACECERHQGLHINADGVYVEILRDGQPVRAGEQGQVHVTDLVNRAMPLLRYQVGDLAVLSNRRCVCGRGLPLLERIAGRVADYVVTPSGRLISGISLTENFALKVPGVAQFQIVQETAHEFVFRLVRGPEFGPASLDRLRELVRVTFGTEVGYRCEFLDRIPAEASGKYRFCISRVQVPYHETARAGESCLRK
jgi:phenylacetate-CoA ligase